MLTVLRQRNFFLLWTSGLLSSLGDTVLLVALPFYVYQETGSTVATGAIFVVETLPRLVLGSVAGVLVDRWNRQRTMVVSDVLRAVVLLFLLLLPYSPSFLWIIFPVAFLQAVLAQFFAPANGALRPQIVEPEHLQAANALGGVSGNINRLIGPALGGALLGLVGLTSVVLVDAISFLCSAVMIALIRLPPTSADIVPSSAAPLTASRSWGATFWDDWLSGLRLVRTDRIVSTLFVVMGVLLLAQGLLNVLLLPFVYNVLGGDALVLGWIATAQGVGGLIGSLSFGRISNAIAPGRLVVICSVLGGLLALATFNSRSIPAVLILSAIAGLPIMGLFISITTLLQIQVANQFRGRIFGALNTTQALTLLVGLGLASGLTGPLGVILLLNVVGALYLFAAIIAAVRLPRGASPAYPSQDPETQVTNR